MPRPTEEDDDQPTTAWNGNQEEGEYLSSQQTKNTLSPRHQEDNNTVPTMPKKVSFAAEVEEQQEKINKESARRDVCCSIQ